jgi:hypothetical protein
MNGCRGSKFVECCKREGMRCKENFDRLMDVICPVLGHDLER